MTNICQVKLFMKLLTQENLKAQFANQLVQALAICFFMFFVNDCLIAKQNMICTMQ